MDTVPVYKKTGATTGTGAVQYCFDTAPVYRPAKTAAAYCRARFHRVSQFEVKLSSVAHERCLQHALTDALINAYKISNSTLAKSRSKPLSITLELG